MPLEPLDPAAVPLWQVLPRDFFNLLRSQKGAGFEAFIREHLIPIEGEMDQPALGFSPELLAKLKDEVRLCHQSIAIRYFL